MSATMTDTERESNREQLEAQMQPFAILGAALKTGKATKRLIASLRDDYGYDADSIVHSLALETYAQAVQDDVLEVATDLRGRLVLVLCTGGPHCEIVGNRVSCWGWFGDGKTYRNLKASERRAVEHLFG